MSLRLFIIYLYYFFYFHFHFHWFISFFLLLHLASLSFSEWFSDFQFFISHWLFSISIFSFILLHIIWCRWYAIDLLIILRLAFIGFNIISFISFFFSLHYHIIFYYYIIFAILLRWLSLLVRGWAFDYSAIYYDDYDYHYHFLFIYDSLRIRAPFSSRLFTHWFRRCLSDIISRPLIFASFYISLPFTLYFSHYIIRYFFRVFSSSLPLPPPRIHFIFSMPFHYSPHLFIYSPLYYNMTIIH